MSSRPLGAKKQMLYYGSGIVLMKAVSLLMLPVITRYLTPSEYGVLDVLLTWMNLLSIVLGLGLTDVLYRFCQNQAEQHQTARLLVQLHYMLLLPALLLLSLLLSGIQSWLPSQLTLNLLLLSLWAAGMASALTIPLCLLRMRDQADWFFYCTAGKALVQALLCWALLHAGYGLVAVLYASLISHVFLLLVLHKEVSLQPVLWPWNRQFTDFLRYGWPLVLSGLCLFLVCGAERWVIAGVLTAGDLAQYAIASQFAMMVAVSIEPFTLWWYPKRIAMLAGQQGAEQVANTATIGCLLSLAAAIAIGTLGPHLIHHLLPQGFHEAAVILPSLCLAMALKQCSHLLNTGCYTGNNTRQVGKINAVLAILAPCIFILGCVLGGLVGLLGGLILLYSIRLWWFYQVSQRLLQLPYPTTTLQWSLLAGFTFLLLVPFLPVPFQLIAAALLLSIFALSLWSLWRKPATSTFKELCE